MMDLQTKYTHTQKGLTVLTACCIGAYLITFFIMNFFGFAQFCDTDMYADTTFARLMWEQKSFFPEGWVFGNQYYVVATPVFAALFYGITGNINTAMILATELMTILIFISFFWLLHTCTSEPLEYLIGILMLIASVMAPSGAYSEAGQLFFLQASYYSCYLITLFFVLGDYVRSIQSAKRRLMALSFCLFLSYATGIQSLRQTVVMILPLLACEFLQALRRVFHHQKPWDRSNVGSLLRVLSYSVANIAGYVTSQCLNLPHSSLYGSTQLAYRNEYFQRLYFTWIYGLRGLIGVNFFSGEDISPFHAVFSLVIIGFFLSSTILWIVRINKPETPLKLCWFVCLVAIGGTCLASVLFYISIRSIYLFTWYPLIALSVLIIIQQLSHRPRYFLIALICLLSLGNLFHSYLPGAKLAVQNSLYSSGTPLYSETDVRNANARKMCDWAVSHGYKYVYGDWFTAPRIAVHSGGQLVAGYWWKTDIYCPLGYLNIQNIYGSKENEKAVYVFTSEDCENGLTAAQNKGVPLTKVAEFGDYTAYTSPVPLMHQKPEI